MKENLSNSKFVPFAPKPRREYSLKSSTKNAKIKTASVFGVDIKPERIESVKDDITLDRLFEIQGEKIDKRS